VSLKSAMIGGALLLSGCSSQLATVHQLRLSPEQAVFNAAGSAEGIKGTFEMVVRATGRQGSHLYLNSQADYRDPRNLSIDIDAVAEQQLAARFRADPESYLIGKVIAVSGVARKTRIDFIADGHRTGKYYYQTHLMLHNARSLTVSGERPSA